LFKEGNDPEAGSINRFNRLLL